MATLRIHAKPYAGDYELDVDDAPLTTLEWRWMKQLSGYLPATISEGIRGGDPDVQLALAVIALVRAGRVSEQNVREAADRLAHAAVDAIEELPDPSAIAEAEDPTKAQATNSPASNGGGSGNSISDPPASDPRATGPLDSPRYATYDRATSPP
jgi:hypothetical protein